MQKMSNFFQRIIFGTLFSAIVCLSIYYSSVWPGAQPFFVAITGIFTIAALSEYYHISKNNGNEPLGIIGMFGSICYLLVIYLTLGKPEYSDWPTITLGLILFSAFLSYFFSGISPFSNLAVTIFGVVYLTIPFGYFIPINFTYGRIWMLYLVLISKITDVGAYFIGKQWGRHQLAPMISPKKTWEGLPVDF